MVPEHTRPGDVLAGRYRLTDLLTESEGGRFWRAFDSVLQRDVAVHIIPLTDARAPLLRDAARRSATVLDRRMLRVLDIDDTAESCFVVNEWGSGTSLDILLAGGPLSPTVAAWVVAEVADTLALAHGAGVAHGRLVPENVLIDQDGAVRLIGFAVDAALHGLPGGRLSADVVDLVGLLYAGLTGKWAGVSPSAVPAAPAQHGHVLRPRQVRAGIPRSLDSLCDHVLNQGGDADVSAAYVSDSLRDFLGTSAAAAEAWLARIDHPRKGQETVVLPALADPPVREGDFATDTTSGSDDPPDQPDPLTDEVAETDDVSGDGGLATQAGMPIFHDDRDDVTWLARQAETAPPPPPFEPHPERPLFAPDPAVGQPARRPRTLAPPIQPGGGGFWPWDNSGAGTGSGLLPAYVDEDEEDEDEGHRPGTRWLRLAGILAACLLVLIACVIAFNLGRGRGPLGATTDSSTPSGPSSSPTGASGTTQPLTGISARDFDPQGKPPVENPAESRFVVDGNPSTGWQTARYNENFGPAGLKTGVGVVLDLGAGHRVAQVDLTMVGSPTTVQVFVTPQEPTGVQGLTAAGQATVTGTHGVIRLSTPTTGRYVTVWLTSLPAVPGGFRGEITEAVVRGE